MTIDDKIRDEKLQYNIKREAAKISALSELTNINVLHILLQKKRSENK